MDGSIITGGAIELNSTEELIVEVLTARHRLGSEWWHFRESRSLKKAMTVLSERMIVETSPGIIPDTIQARFTMSALDTFLGNPYTPPSGK